MQLCMLSIDLMRTDEVVFASFAFHWRGVCRRRKQGASIFARELLSKLLYLKTKPVVFLDYFVEPCLDSANGNDAQLIQAAKE